MSHVTVTKANISPFFARSCCGERLLRLLFDTQKLSVLGDIAEHVMDDAINYMGALLTETDLKGVPLGR